MNPSNATSESRHLQFVRLENIKGVRNAEIYFKRLNVLIGANNVGKSTIFQAMLVVAQSFRDADRVDFPRLPLNGRYVNLGTFDDFRSGFATPEQQTKVTVCFADSSLTLELGPSRDAKDDPSSEIREFLFSEGARGARIEGPKRDKDTSNIYRLVSSDEDIEIGVRKPEFEDVRRVLSIVEVFEGNSIDLDDSTPPSVGFIGNPFGGAFALIEPIEMLEVYADLCQQYSIQGSDRDLFLVELAKSLREIPPGISNSMHLKNALFRALETSREGGVGSVSIEEHRIAVRELQSPRRIHKVERRVELSKVVKGFNSIQYLGPLRYSPAGEAPQGNSPVDVGVRGESTLSFLAAHYDDVVENPLSIEDQMLRGVLSDRCQLLEAVNYWMQRFGLSEKLEVKLSHRGVPSLTVTRRGLLKDLDWSTLGMGANQLLPCIVLTLSSVPNAQVVLIEQPELHLHPVLEARLGDFFLQSARTGRQIVIETHSEHLVERLRRRIAESDTSDPAKDLVNLIFAESSEDETTSYRSVQFNEFGGLHEDWPKGFMELSNEDMMLTVRAAAAKAAQPHNR